MPMCSRTGQSNPTRATRWLLREQRGGSKTRARCRSQRRRRPCAAAICMQVLLQVPERTRRRKAHAGRACPLYRSGSSPHVVHRAQTTHRNVVRRAAPTLSATGPRVPAGARAGSFSSAAGASPRRASCRTRSSCPRSPAARQRVPAGAARQQRRCCTRLDAAQRPGRVDERRAMARPAAVQICAAQCVSGRCEVVVARQRVVQASAGVL